MYLRFVSPVAPGGYTVTRSHVAPGLFRPAYGLWCQHRDAPSPALIGIRREIDWFEDNLPVPRRLGVKAKGRWYSDGVCWFRDSAREMLAHAYTLAALIEECGVRIDRVRSRDPGQILYRDDWQVVAMPERYREIRSIPPPVGLSSFIWRWVCRGIGETSRLAMIRRAAPQGRPPVAPNGAEA
ncbi:hypothetical protein P7228_04720 [Altererythrobacter arenosus]|uniref:Uncharacterized protein n=1 Tax=Altererythrobacter arenosus TaxID=3032592 RepID=A0ABY8FVV4_9SPHN|nr:hypothetical protein [Altererythrobacter sp. CAU 1644]WFL78370.1 hypothetical protein P7228_04720 [Altererythrobacter sp. CAU 1644]